MRKDNRKKRNGRLSGNEGLDRLIGMQTLNVDESTDGRGMNDEQSEGPEGWVDRHGDCLYRYAMMRLEVPDRAADVVQETFLEALRPGSFAGRSSKRPG